MAKKESNNDKKVTRISASDETSKKTVSNAKAVSKKTVAKKEVAKKTKGTEDRKKGPVQGFVGYFTGAWYELRQVRWPNRGATWSLTGAVIAFTAFFVLFIVVLDTVFGYLFELILT